MFLNALKSKEWSAHSPSPSSCIVCKKIHEEETLRIKEASEELKTLTVGPWLKDHAKFCVRHLSATKGIMSEATRKAIDESAICTASALEKELQQAKLGNHAGGGLLGRAAEFLVA